MKKLLLGLLQIISYCIIYEIVVWLMYLIISLLISLIASFPFLKLLFTDLVIEGITFTFAPLISAMIIVFILGVLFRKTGLYDIPTVIMIMILAYTNISNIIYSAKNYGIISWGFANTVWQSIILCGIIIVGLFGLAGIAKRS